MILALLSLHNREGREGGVRGGQKGHQVPCLVLLFSPGGKVFEKRCKIVIQEGEDKCNVIRQCCIYEQSHIHGLKPDVGCKCVSPEKYGSAGMGSRKGMPGFPQYEV